LSVTPSTETSIFTIGLKRSVVIGAMRIGTRPDGGAMNNASIFEDLKLNVMKLILTLHK